MIEVKRQLNAKAIAQQVGSGSGGGSASSVTYDNTTSGLTATNVQGAIDELASTGHVYSTTAKKVGKWTDNKDVYEIVIHLESAYEPKPAGTELPASVQTLLAGADTVISCQGVSATQCVGIGLEYASSTWTGYTAVEWSLTDLILTYTVAPTP